MDKVTFIAYFGWVVWIGVIITGDAFISTLSQFHNTKLKYLNWAGFLALTHSIFPAVSFIIFATIASIGTAASTGVNLFGAAFILLVVHEMLSNALGTKPVFSLSDWIESETGLDKHVAEHTMKVLAVSWDAASLGPFLILKSQEQQWDIYMIFGAFITFGIIVGGSLAFTLWLSGKLREKHFSDTNRLTKLNFYGNFFEISVISSFAVTLLLEVCSIDSSPLTSLLITITIFATVFFANRALLWENARIVATRSVSAIE